MPKPASHEGHTFSQARQDHASEIAADYVELIDELHARMGEARGADISRKLGVSHVTVSNTIKRLVRDGYVIARPYRSIFLTEKGKELAESSRERHRLVVALLEKIGVPNRVAEADAEGMEHHVSPTTLRAIKKYLL